MGRSPQKKNPKQRPRCYRYNGRQHEVQQQCHTYHCGCLVEGSVSSIAETWNPILDSKLPSIPAQEHVLAEH